MKGKLVNNELKWTSKEAFVIRGFVTGLSWINWTEPKTEYRTVVISAEIRRVHLLIVMQKQHRSGKRASYRKE